MTPQDFIRKWRSSELKERSGSHSHFIDLCQLLGVEDPSTADQTGEWYTFEKGASKTTGGNGWADVWKDGCFAWEYKGKDKDLNRAFAQLQRYAVALNNPPLLIVSDMDRIRIHTNWTNTVQKVHEIALTDLVDAAQRDLLRACFQNPDKLKPQKTRQVLTEEAAQRFALIAQRLRGRGHDAHAVAHFVNRLVFCMFAEDVGLLPDRMFERMIKLSRPKPETFAAQANKLFTAMRTGGDVGFERVEWFNGGLFDSDETLPLTWEDLDDLIRATMLDWSDIDPSVLGTLFERGLDPGKRSQLGAHYTDRDKIMQIVQPVIVQPLLAEWEAVKAQIIALAESAPKATQAKLLVGADLAARNRALARAEALHLAFLDRLKAFRVLDPACGSGNFLYVALTELKNIEHRANLEAEALGLQRPALQMVGPENVLGIELNSYAAELARVSVWIGEIQWMRRNGFEASRNPILRTLDTIENRDAVLGPNGGPADWPRADVVVGNPPFLGNKKMIAGLGETYTNALRRAYPDVPGGVDLVAYWFARAWQQMQAGEVKQAGLVCTNSIRGGANRAVLKPIVDGGRIFEAWADEVWTIPASKGGRAASPNDAAVRVSMICFKKERQGLAKLDGKEARQILSDLTTNLQGVDLTRATRLRENHGISIIGRQKDGPLDVDGETGRDLVTRRGNPQGKSNSEIVRPWRNGLDITRRSSDKWIIDFMDMEEPEAMLFEAPFEYTRFFVKPIRAKNRDAKRLSHWWRPGRTGDDLRKALAGLPRFLATPRVAKHRLFVWLDASVNPDCQIVVFARDDDRTFGILHSRFHELWSLRMGTSLEDRPRYTPSTTFETFPFPVGLTPSIPAAASAADPRAQKIAAAAARLNELRENWLNPPDLVKCVREVVPGYPDRLLPVSPEAAVTLKQRTLTNLYNARPAWLDHAHRALDEAVAEAYGWGDDWRAGKLTDDEILARLFRMNQERAG